MAPHGTSAQHDRPGSAPDGDVAALADRIGVLLRAHSLPVAIATAIIEREPIAGGPAYIGQRESGLTRRQWQSRIADGRLKAWKDGKRYVTTPAALRACLEADPVQPKVTNTPAPTDDDTSAAARVRRLEQAGHLEARHA